MILNRQRRVSVPIAPLEKFLARIRRHFRLPQDSLTIALVGDSQIARWNRAYRGKDRPTDVLSFPSLAQGVQNRSRERGSGKRKVLTSASFTSSPSSTSYLGDIAIAPAVARRNARRFGRTFTLEMQILILHGILHLLGYDHETDTGQMDRLEQSLRRELGLS